MERFITLHNCSFVDEKLNHFDTICNNINFGWLLAK